MSRRADHSIGDRDMSRSMPRSLNPIRDRRRTKGSNMTIMERAHRHPAIARVLRGRPLGDP